jgi:hypothetical protein
MELVVRAQARQIKERIGVFIAVSTGIKALVIAPRLEQGRGRCKQFVTVGVLGVMSGCMDQMAGCEN